MGRFLMYTAIGALALFVLTATFVIEESGKGTQATGEITIHDILLAPERYKGKVVTTQGVLRRGNSATEFLVTDADSLGIIVQYDAARLRPLNGVTVSVTGTFDFENDTGVYIEADVVRRVE